MNFQKFGIITWLALMTTLIRLGRKYNIAKAEIFAILDEEIDSWNRRMKKVLK